MNYNTILSPISDSSDCRLNAPISNTNLIKVVVYTPDKLTDAARQAKINKIYDLLKPRERINN